MSCHEDKERCFGSLVLWGPFTPVGDDDLNRVETAVGRPLPPDYRSFLKAAHGGTLQYAVRLPPDRPDGHWLEFSDLFTAVGEGSGSLIGEWRSHPGTHMADHVPAAVLPVARDGGGSTLLLDLREEAHGRVWAFVHGLPAWAGGDGLNRGGVVAESWTEYLGMLTVDEDMARDIWEDAREGAEPDWLPSVVHWLDAGLPRWRSLPWAGDVPDFAADG